MKVRISPLVFVFALVAVLCGSWTYLIGYLVAVVMHEMTHAEVAKRLGYTLSELKIMPYGASLTGKFEGVSARDEFLIAIAGPLSNIFAALVCTALWWLAPSTYYFTESFVVANVFTAVTNILPVFPLDGGRALLAILSRKIPRQRAYKIIRVAGFVVTAAFVALFVLSLIYSVNFTFALMALFVLLSTLFPDKNSKYQRLYSMAYRSEKLRHGLTVREIMVADTLTLYALTKMLNGNYYHRFCVVNEKLEPSYCISETLLEEILSKYPRDTLIKSLPPSLFDRKL